MIANELGQQLHDRATKGEILSIEEQMQLEQWYSHLDSIEGEILNKTAPRNPIVELQEKIDEMKKYAYSIAIKIWCNCSNK